MGKPVTVEDIDIYRAANVLIRGHGDEAPIHAAMRHDELLSREPSLGAGVHQKRLFPKTLRSQVPKLEGSYESKGG